MIVKRASLWDALFMMANYFLAYDPQASQFSGLSNEQLMSDWFCSTIASGSRVSAACFSTVNLMAGR